MEQIKHFLLTVAMLLCCTSLFAHDFEIDGIYYNITSSADKTVAVTYRSSNGISYSDEYSGSVSIPESVTYNGTTYSVRSIGVWAFEYCSGLTSVTIPNSVTSIGIGAFRDCSDLTSVTIPNSVTSIGISAFSGCSRLTSIEIPNSVTSIGSWAFIDCSGLTSVTIPNSVKRIEIGTFEDCSGLTTVTIPNSVTSIGYSAFYGCSGLTSVEIPNSVTSIGYSAFSGCSGLTSIIVDDENTTYDSRDNCNAIIETSSNTLIVGCKSTIIPNSVTSIGDKAFYDCSGLTSISIPNSVTSIGSNAFDKCDVLTLVAINCTNVEPWFQQNERIKRIVLGDSVKRIEIDAFNGCKGLVSIKISNGLTFIGNRAFYGCSCLTSVEIPDSAPCSIGNWAFEDCASLTSIKISKKASNIGKYAFAGCYNLKSVSIPHNVVGVGENAFENCTNLNWATIGNGVKNIRSGAFSGCTNLKSLTIGNRVENIEEEAFSGCDKLEEIVALSRTAIECNENIFSTTAYNNAILYVPEGREFAYEKTTPWCNFYIKTIPTNINNVEVDADKDAPVYNLHGVRMQNTDNLPAGIYIKNGKKYMVR